MELLFFGSLTDITGKSRMDIGSPGNLDALKEKLISEYPALVNRSFLVAVNKKVQSGNVQLHDNDVVALMPPFSGG